MFLKATTHNGETTKIIEGNLILDGQKHINTKIIIKSCIFTGRVSFHHIIFEEDVDFSGTIFKLEASFDASHFMKDTYFCSRSGEYPFKYAEFYKYADFGCTHFHHYVDFQKVRFREGATFKSATFHKIAKPDFSSAYFEDDTEFIDVTFECGASFQEARFHGPVSFSTSTTFERKVDFIDAIFYEKASFLSCIFKEDVNFGSATFNKGLLLNRSHFYNILSLDNVEAKTIGLLGATFERDSTFSLKGSYFDRLVVRWDIINGHLDVAENREFTEDNIDAIYLSLVKSFKDLGFFDDADKCYLQYRSRISKRLIGKGCASRIPDWISYNLYGHGVDYWPPLKFCGVIIGVFTIIFAILNHFDDSIAKSFQLLYSNPIYQSIRYSFVAFVTNPPTGSEHFIWPFILGLERLIGTIILSALLVTIVRKTLR